jgi:hypothetical protein
MAEEEAGASSSSQSSSHAPLKVTFDKSTVICGITSNDIDTRGTVLATISPGAEADNVTFDTDDHGRATVAEDSRTTDPSTGDVSVLLYVSGVSASAVEGDVMVQAIAHEDLVVQTIPVTVVIPKSIGPRSPIPFDDIVTGQNALGTAGSSPAYVDEELEPDEVVLWTLYGTTITVTVLDQFGHTLDSVYDGAKVEEEGHSLNVTISSGQYADPIGVQFTKYSSGFIFDIADLEAVSWPLDPPAYPLDFSDVANPNVSVDGHGLDPAPARTIQLTPQTATTARLQIFW